MEDVPLFASRPYGSCRSAVVVAVDDGDTILVNVPNWPDIVGKNIPLRLYGVDAPEKDDVRPEIAALGMKAKQRLTELLPVGTKLVLTNMRRDKYFRIICHVSAGGKDVAKIMVEEGLLRPYKGEGPKPW